MNETHNTESICGENKNSMPVTCRLLVQPHGPGNEPERIACSRQDGGLLEAGPSSLGGPLLGPEGLQPLFRCGEGCGPGEDTGLLAKWKSWAMWAGAWFCWTLNICSGDAGFLSLCLLLGAKISANWLNWLNCCPFRIVI